MNTDIYLDEIWAPVPGFLYLEVSTKGAVRTLERKATRSPDARGNTLTVRPAQILSQCINASGYLTVAVTSLNGRGKYAVHRLVALAFVPGNFEGATVYHMDGNKLNNRTENLEWITRAENVLRQKEKSI